MGFRVESSIGAAVNIVGSFCARFTSRVVGRIFSEHKLVDLVHLCRVHAAAM